MQKSNELGEATTPGGWGNIALALSALALALVLSGCATMDAASDRVDISLTAQPMIYKDQWVNRNAPEIHVQPRESAAFAPRVLFVPFRVTQGMQSPTMAAHAVSRTVYQTWNSMQLFPAMEYSNDDTPYRRDRALQLGVARGADVVVGGFITYFYAGGTAGPSQLAIQVEAHDVTSGQLIWSMAQGGAMPASQTNDYILFATRTRLPADPIHAISRSLAIDMGKVVQNWLAGPTEKTRMQQVDERVKETLFPKHDPTPHPRPMQGEAQGQGSF